MISNYIGYMAQIEEPESNGHALPPGSVSEVQSD